MSEDSKGLTRKKGWVALGLLLPTLAVILLSAWVCDDAYITFRVVDNFWNGYGLRWNVIERVCVYTNPLMMLSMMALYPLTGEFFYTSVFFSMAVSLAAVAIVLRGMARNLITLLFAFGLLMVSKAFVDYTTSGLEQCLTYLFLAVFYWLAFKKDLASEKTFLLLALMAGLGTLNRMDCVLLFLPLLALAWWQKRSWKRLGLIMLGFLPLIVWMVFATIYYGSPFPNTAYAKLNTGLSLSYYVGQGFHYYTNSLRQDPITIPIIVGAIIASFLSKKARVITAAIGIVLYLLYILRVGGCFMSGRMFSAPLLCAVMLWCVIRLGIPAGIRNKLLMVTATGMLVVGLFHPLSPLRSGPGFDYSHSKLQNFAINGGRSDERGGYYQTCGLLRAGKYPHMPAHPRRDAGSRLREAKVRFTVGHAIGMVGYYGGAELHVFDIFALSDPFLSRLPVISGGTILIGHMERGIPNQYVDSVTQGKNVFKDSDAGALYDAVRRIHSGPIWSSQRWADIWSMHIGKYDKQLKNSVFYEEYSRSSITGLYPSKPRTPDAKPGDFLQNRGKSGRR